MSKERKILLWIFSMIILLGLIVYASFVRFKSNIGDNAHSDTQGEAFTFDSNEFDKYIFVGGSNKAYIEGKIHEYFEIYGKEGDITEYYIIEEYKTANIIEVLDTVDFYEYHNIIGWLAGMESDKNIPKYSVGYAVNKLHEEISYICCIEDMAFGDTLVGQFSDGRIITIYLPDAFNETAVVRNENYDISILEDYKEMLKKDGILN